MNKASRHGDKDIFPTKYREIEIPTMLESDRDVIPL